jgi:hypothetical protein
VLSDARTRILWLLGRASQNSWITRLAKVPAERIILADERPWGAKNGPTRWELFGMPDVLVLSEDGTLSQYLRPLKVCPFLFDLEA